MTENLPTVEVDHGDMLTVVVSPVFVARLVDIDYPHLGLPLGISHFLDHKQGCIAKLTVGTGEKGDSIHAVGTIKALTQRPAATSASAWLAWDRV